MTTALAPSKTVRWTDVVWRDGATVRGCEIHHGITTHAEIDRVAALIPASGWRG